MTRRVEREQPSGWAAGWLGFGAVSMILLGVWWIIVGIAALADNEYYVVTENYVFAFDIATWGWISTILGAVVTAAGFTLLTGAAWARVVTVLVASLAAVTGFAWLPWNPVGAALMVALAVAVVWAVTVHGREIADS